MGEPAIVAKLRRELTEQITTERQVVYILVEIRKLIETKNEKATYPYLWFYANWAVHPTLEHGIVFDLLKKFDEAQGIYQKSPKLPEPLRRNLNEITAMRQFPKELEEFLNAHNLPTDIVYDGWTGFLRLYADIIQDCPLVVSPKKALKHILKVTVKVEDAPDALVVEDEKFSVYNIRWLIQGRDNKQGEIFMLFTIP